MVVGEAEEPVGAMKEDGGGGEEVDDIPWNTEAEEARLVDELV